MVWVAIIARGLELYENDDEEENYEDAGNDENPLRERRYGTPWPGRRKRGRKSDNNELQPSELQQIISPDPSSIVTEVRKINSDPNPTNNENTTEL
jgi:hypothetical protein